MSTLENVKEICKTVLEKVTPKKKERETIEALAVKLENGVRSAAEELCVPATVRVEGSVAKDTWLSGDPDVDVFMRVSPAIPRTSLGDVCLRVARKATAGSKQIERFAEHPYLEAFVDDVRVNVVPCYDVKRGEWQSATDRTPFHTDYMNRRLDGQLRGEVRLLKKFLKGVGVYGAEIKIGGFSGYLTELLVLQYRSFESVLKAFANCKQRIVVDIENHYRNRENELRLLFKEPLVVVDPVDRGRNVASAVQEQKLSTLVAASQTFLKNPHTEFFDPTETKALTVDQLEQELRKRGSAIVFLTFGHVNAVPDVLWGQLYKSQRSLRKLVEMNGFSILRDAAWSDERALNMFIFELENCCIPLVVKHLGPPLDKEHECEKFLAKHQNGLGTISGPYIENGRWIVLLRRKYTDACALLSERLKDGGKNAGVADKLSKIVRKGLKIHVNEEVAGIYAKNNDFAVFLTEFLSGKPKWLVAAQAQHY